MKSMRILGIDTTTKLLCLGLYDGICIYEYNLEVGTRLSSLLGLTIKRVLDALGWRPCDIDYFVCGLGPGSFTGIRVGMATIKGLAFSLNKPVVGISTLDILARNAKVTDGSVVPIIDAKRSLIYCSVYKTKDNMQKRIMPYMLLAEEAFFRKINLSRNSRYIKQKSISNAVKNNTVILGDAVSLYKEKILKNIRGANILDKDYWYPKAGNIITLALERIRDKKFSNPFDIKPIYLYPKECQIKSM